MKLPSERWVDTIMPAALFKLFNDRDAELGNKLVGIFGLLIAANVLAWVWALIAFRDYPLLVGTAFLAYAFGLRHAVDADHIAAIDNVTRKLMQEGKRPIGAGFFFALGHSSVAIVAAPPIDLAAGAGFFFALGHSSVGIVAATAIALTAGSVQARFPGLIQSGSVLGTAISAS